MQRFFIVHPRKGTSLYYVQNDIIHYSTDNASEIEEVDLPKAKR